jgi:nitrite reductase/ring-hydroxylating ferredoxin subunit
MNMPTFMIASPRFAGSLSPGLCLRNIGIGTAAQPFPALSRRDRPNVVWHAVPQQKPNKDVSMAGSGEWVRVASVSDVADGEPLAVEVLGLSLAVYHVGDEWFCTDNICTHAMALLTDGWLDGYVVECPLHAGQFDIRNGKGLSAPIDKDLDTFAVRIEGEDVMVELP